MIIYNAVLHSYLFTLNTNNALTNLNHKKQPSRIIFSILWWCHEMKTLPKLLIVWNGNPPVMVDSPHKGYVMWNFSIFYASLNKLFNKLSSCQWCERPSPSYGKLLQWKSFPGTRISRQNISKEPAYIKWNNNYYSTDRKRIITPCKRNDEDWFLFIWFPYFGYMLKNNIHVLPCSCTHAVI